MLRWSSQGWEWPVCLRNRVKQHKAEKLNSYELLVFVERVVPGLGGLILCEAGLNKAKSRLCYETKIVECCNNCLYIFVKNKGCCRFQSEISDFASCKKQSVKQNLSWKIQVRGHHWRRIVMHKASKTVETVLIIYLYIQLYIQAGGVDKRTVHFQRAEECTEGMYPPYCSRSRRGVGSLHITVEDFTNMNFIVLLQVFISYGPCFT